MGKETDGAQGILPGNKTQFRVLPIMKKAISIEMASKALSADTLVSSSFLDDSGNYSETHEG